MSKKGDLNPIVALGAILVASLAGRPGANAADNPFIKSGKAKSDEGDHEGVIEDYDRTIEINIHIVLDNENDITADFDQVIELEHEVEDR